MILKYGKICVLREVRGIWEALPLDPQWHYREWVGCFTYIGVDTADQTWYTTGTR
jgi:hypothetical protein